MISYNDVCAKHDQLVNDLPAILSGFRIKLTADMKQNDKDLRFFPGHCDLSFNVIHPLIVDHSRIITISVSKNVDCFLCFLTICFSFGLSAYL